jgi:DNA repair photolyase
MGLNISKGNMYEWVSGTKNPLAGKCLHGCTYCSTNSLMRYPGCYAKYSGPIRLDYNLLNQNLGKDKTWFIVGQNDLFAEGVPESFIIEVFNWCKKYDNTYLFQTKNPDRYIPLIKEFPEKSILCTTIETNRIFYREMGNTPLPITRAFAMNHISEFPKQVTIEPVFDFDLEEMIELIKWCNPKSVNIGADSKGHHLPEPSKEKLLVLIDELKKFTIIERKTNLNRILNS